MANGHTDDCLAWTCSESCPIANQQITYNGKPITIRKYQEIQKAVLTV